MTSTPPPVTDSAAPAPEPGSVPVPAARTAAESAAAAPPSRRFLARATLVTAVLTALGSMLGLGRDQALSYLFGAGSETDAFLVAWTIPEFAATLLIEDGMAIVLVPMLSVAVARRAQGAPGDPVRSLVATTLPRLSLAFAAVAALLIAGAPYVVAVLAPGLSDPGLAVHCTRLTATCVFTFGLAGYCSAALRAHRRFTAPAAIYVAYNAGIITAMFALGETWGVRAAAVGVAVGGALMILAQLPSLLRELRHKSSASAAAVAQPERPLGLALVSTVLLFALCRQSQVLIERFLGSTLPAGAISHLNYAQKVAQIPMTFSLMLCTVTFPVVAQALAEGDTERARKRVEKDLTLVASIVLLGAAAIVACAPQITELLFQRGAFTAQDTAATAAVMRVYALGLLGHSMVGALIRSYFSSRRPTWYPLAAMAAGILVTSVIGALTAGSWGVCGLAAANAAGITVTASLLLHGARGRGVPIRVRQVVAGIGRPVRAAVLAGAAGLICASTVDSPVLGLAVGCAVVSLVFVALAWTGAGGITPALRSVTRRLPHARHR
ncbi:murein biosynthesis integral membrane protein MurJ [Streptomyces bluensis]|uniref:murein biosynthesis integral membrane protein MurJ n=1 Tax=Streptomyces bluensis TaxID=33897 RepID=UPI0016776F97|nr:lipid II flippase MurJ [Streptomyces bluensis]GGZ73354.1 membrane protein [Streptomyces bluensis]